MLVPHGDHLLQTPAVLPSLTRTQVLQLHRNIITEFPLTMFTESATQETSQVQLHPTFLHRSQVLLQHLQSTIPLTWHGLRQMETVMLSVDIILSQALTVEPHGLTWKQTPHQPQQHMHILTYQQVSHTHIKYPQLIL